jgi:hypothetical protein
MPWMVTEAAPRRGRPQNEPFKIVTGRQLSLIARHRMVADGLNGDVQALPFSRKDDRAIKPLCILHHRLPNRIFGNRFDPGDRLDANSQIGRFVARLRLGAQHRAVRFDQQAGQGQPLTSFCFWRERTTEGGMEKK